ncbi:MAG: chromosome segregation protein [Pirellulaceae bacterium]|jgi:chromosome segregation protein
MLKALELCGFKSFADKTRFEFPAGITVVVGPNGSGKSNIVDAIKWVLGEQSAKSLRGKDMSDVIFKGGGAGSGGRKAMNCAEATIVLDNADGRFEVDAAEVHVTRRVYRSGEGEYLINRQPCRLKDIRDMFRGTGVGTDAYSLIEQGKVDRLLQASTKDRRAIFEEAAGISRFKAKKVEAQRRLARVDQNLLRLSDIVDEVESRLRSVRNQAGKARRYREFTDRLQQLRTQVGQTDWFRLTQTIQALEQTLDNLGNDGAEISASLESNEATVLEIETHSIEANENIRSAEHKSAKNYEQIATRESACEQHRQRCSDLEDESRRYRNQLAAMSSRIGDVQFRLKETTESLATAETQHLDLSSRVAEHERVLDDLTINTETLRTVCEQRREDYVAKMKENATLGNRESSLESQLRSLRETSQRCQQRCDDLAPLYQQLSQRLRDVQGQEAELDANVAKHTEALDDAQEDLQEQRRVLTRRQDELVEMQGRLSGTQQRANVLSELERTFEGLNEGVKQILEGYVHQPDSGKQVHGVIADLVEADIQYAPSVDVALGEMAQRIVLQDGELLQQLRNGETILKGRAGFVLIDAPVPRRESDWVRLDGLTGVIGRADRLVRFDKTYDKVVSRMLGSTWFVRELDDAYRLQRQGAHGVRFVTEEGQILESDGSLTLGPRHASSGLVSRRSELRVLQQDIKDLEFRITESTNEIMRLRENIEQKDRNTQDLNEKHRQSVAALADFRGEVKAVRQQHNQIELQMETLAAELKAAEAQSNATSEQLSKTIADRKLVDTEVAELEIAIKQDESKLEDVDLQRQKNLRETTAAKVELAKSEQQLDGLQIRMLQFQEDKKERNKGIVEARAQLVQALSRHELSERETLRLTSELAELYLYKEELVAEVLHQQSIQDQLQLRRKEIADGIQTLRKRQRKVEELQHKKELDAGELKHQRNTMSERLREDYGIDISQLEQETSEEDQQERVEVESEINELRRKLNSIGAVNMEALGELDDLEARFNTLSSQYKDLVDAKDSLERIIQRINADSRRLFTETLEAIRQNFQVLYRKAFGGGRADIILEEGVDVLEAGIDIVATPPGKPSFNNSLLSGGEKALTAVSLLLAIFEYRPSPFCVLDEVDAPFDEANIGRFVDVLKEFLGWTKFVVVTHSKKTMTAANTLYGVTMQESGISKQVSVKFDDVTEDGHIKQDAIDREAVRSETPDSDDEQAA